VSVQAEPEPTEPTEPTEPVEPADALVPEPYFSVGGARHRDFAATPTMVFAGTVAEPTGHEIQSVALSAQLMIDPARRGYLPRTRERLAELFGAPTSWTPSTQGLAWARVTTIVAAFQGSTSFELEVPCTYDLEVAATKYFHALAGGAAAEEDADGEVPLSFHFTGTVFYFARDGRLQVIPVPWSATAQYSMPLHAWRAMIAEHYPGGGWIRLHADTLDALNVRRAARGLASFDACLTELLERDGSDAR
jgi:hypothetical protein